jgi:AcrR family transcriptional regulator
MTSSSVGVQVADPHLTNCQLGLCDEGEGSLTTAERRAREKAQRRREILDAAREEFFERGFHSPTVDDVAARAEVSKGTIYLYFESKEEILAHLLLEGLGVLLAQMQMACDPESEPQAEACLRALAGAYLTFCQSYPSYFRLIMAFDRGRFEESISPKLYEQVLNQSLQGLDLVAQSIKAGAASGAFAVVKPWQAAGSVWAALNGVLVLVAHPMRRQMLRSDVDTMYQATLDLVLAGLKERRG